MLLLNQLIYSIFLSISHDIVWLEISNSNLKVCCVLMRGTRIQTKHLQTHARVRLHAHAHTCTTGIDSYNGSRAFYRSSQNEAQARIDSLRRNERGGEGKWINMRGFTDRAVKIAPSNKTKKLIMCKIFSAHYRELLVGTHNHDQGNKTPIKPQEAHACLLIHVHVFRRERTPAQKHWNFCLVWRPLCRRILFYPYDYNMILFYCAYWWRRFQPRVSRCLWMRREWLAIVSFSPSQRPSQ